MNKKVKWGIIIFIGAGLIGGGIYSQLPKTNEELAAADKVMTGKRGGKKVLNVNARIIKPQLLKDEIQISGSLLPDEEVDLSFETSGKIIEINFEEGSFVKKGQLLAKVNDRPLQAQLQRLVSQLKLAEDRVFRQNALLERDAVSKEAYEQVKTELIARVKAIEESNKENSKAMVDTINDLKESLEKQSSTVEHYRKEMELMRKQLEAKDKAFY